MAELTIRPARPSDVEAMHAAIVKLAHFVGAPEEVSSTEDDLRRYGFGAKPAFSTLIAEIGKEFAGMCLYFPIFSTWMGRPGVYVQDLYVEDRFRGRKIGERLLRQVARLSREEGGAYLRLAVDTDNEGAKAFYERLGIRWSNYEQTQKITGEAFFAFADAPDDGDRQAEESR